MSQKTKNGSSAAEQLAAKVPWTDEAGIGLKIYEGLQLTVEIVVLWIRIIIAYITSFFEVILPKEQKDVSGEIVLVTGAGHGMGREMALKFASLGATVVCVDINPKSNQETLDLIKQTKKKGHRYECDVSSRDAVFAMADRVRKDVGDVTMLINNAGLMPCKKFLNHEEREVRVMFDVNIIAHIWMVQAFLPAMMARNRGHLVAMSSMAGMLGLRNLVPYCASKFAVRGFMEALHEELREDPRDFSGIKFTCVYPYIVDTGLCKNPKIKFPSMMKIVTPAEAAEHIVRAVRLDHLETTIPESLYWVNKWCRAQPYKVPLLVKDFLDSGLESHEDLKA